MAEQEDSSDKPHDPTQRRLDEARRKGEVARSADLATAAAYAGLLLAGLGIGAEALTSLGSGLLAFFDQPDRLAPLVFGGETGAPLPGLVLQELGPLAPLFAVPGLAALLAFVAQRALLFSPQKLQPKGSRISLLRNAKSKFGRTGLFEFAKSFTKLLAYSLVLGLFLAARLRDTAGLVHAGPGLAVQVLCRLCLELLFLVVLITAAIGTLDYLWQRYDHQRRYRMSDQDLRQEHKEAEGDPHMKQARRQRGKEIALNQMMADVPRADVVIVNPTHYAVALKWDRARGSAPVCVAKGVDAVAARIREVAIEAGVPVHRDPPTARALYGATEVGAEIAPPHYRAVATAIRFADAMRHRARGRGR